MSVVSDIGGTSTRRLLALALVHLLTAVAVIPTGLLLPSNFYSVWSAWAVTGVIAWMARRAPYVFPSLVAVDAAVVAVAHVLKESSRASPLTLQPSSGLRP